MSELAQFRLYIQNELEDRISEFPDLGFDEQAFADPDATVNQSVLENKKMDSNFGVKNIQNFLAFTQIDYWECGYNRKYVSELMFNLVL